MASVSMLSYAASDLHGRWMSGCSGVVWACIGQERWTEAMTKRQNGPKKPNICLCERFSWTTLSQS